MGELNRPLDHPLGPSWNKEMCCNGTKLCILGSCWGIDNIMFGKGGKVHMKALVQGKYHLFQNMSNPYVLE
jgi:hypothetical protein